MKNRYPFSRFFVILCLLGVLSPTAYATSWSLTTTLTLLPLIFGQPDNPPSRQGGGLSEADRHIAQIREYLENSAQQYQAHIIHENVERILHTGVAEVNEEASEQIGTQPSELPRTTTKTPSPRTFSNKTKNNPEKTQPRFQLCIPVAVRGIFCTKENHKEF